MTQTLAAPAPEDAPPLFLSPTKADAAPRTSVPEQAKKATKPKPVASDPEAPYGWMKDPVTGEMRPRKTAGRIAPGAGKKAPEPPRNRTANQPRIAPAPPTGIETPDHAAKVAELIDGVWMMAAGLPANKTRVLGIDFGALTVRVKAQASLLADQKPALAHGIGEIADHVPMVGRGVDWLTADNGPGWILPAAMVLIPFVAASAALWRAPLADAQVLADRTDAMWSAMVGSQQEAMAAAIAAETEHRQMVATYPGERPLPGLEAA